MDIRRIAIVAGVTLLFFLFFSGTGVKPKGKHPNFIFILTDDQGWTCVSEMMDDRYPSSKSDYYETPNIDKLGDGGMRFTNGYAPDALCTPSRRSIQFGQTDIRTGNIRFQEHYDPKTNQWLTIPHLLKSIDPAYRTAHYGKWDLRAGFFPEDLGYDESDGNTGNSNGDVMTDKSTKFTQIYVNNDPKRTPTLTARALNFMQRQTKAGNPFYLQVSFYATHVDMETTKKSYKKYQEKEKGRIHDNAGWAGMLADLDEGIGRIADEVGKLGIGDNTYIILMSDNGSVEFLPPVSNRLDPPSTFSKHMRNYPLRGGKWALYEGGIRVPMIIKGPGVRPHVYCHVPVTGYDILPTISDLAGNAHALPDYLDGASIRPLFGNPGGGTVRRSGNALYFHRYAGGYPHSVVIDGNYKLIKFWKTNKEELYDLGKDVGETHDLAAEQPAKVKELDGKLMDYLTRMHAEILDPSLPQGKKKKNKENEDDED
ncbi:MAG TPA: sulfatase [Puia sp.]|nr:sulfatase [Puia sp.]